MNLDGGLEDIRWIRGHGGLEDIRWIRGLGGEKLPASPYDFLPNLKKGLFFAIGEGSIFFVACFLHNSAQMCFYQTPGRRPPRITGRFVNTLTRGWVGAPNEHAPLRFHGAVVFCRSMSVEDAESHRFESTLGRVFCQADLGPTSAQELLCSFLFEFGTFFFC